MDAETGQLHDGGLSDGQREHDLDIGRINIAGELLDLQAGGRLDEDVDPVAVADGIVAAYRTLWTELTESESFPESERWRIGRRVERLNDLGFDIEELSIRKDETGTQVRIQPKVVDAGHHSRRLLRLTGLDAGENQARRLLNDLDAYRATGDRKDLDEEHGRPRLGGAGVRTGDPFDPQGAARQAGAGRGVPSVARAPLVPLAEREAQHPARRGAEQSYVDTVLRHRRDEMTVVAPPTASITLPIEVIDADGDGGRGRRRAGLAVEGMSRRVSAAPGTGGTARPSRWRGRARIR